MLSENNPEKLKPEEDSIAKFRDASDKLAELGPRLEALFREPWPDWFTHVLLRFARIVAPEMQHAAKAGDRERMAGHIAGGESALRETLLKSNALAEIRKLDHPIWKTLGDELEEFAGPEGVRIKQTMQAANDLPTQHAGSFFAAFGKAINEDAPEDMLERWASSTTAQICAFLLGCRLRIEANQFKNITELINFFFAIQAAWGIEEENLEVKKSLESQFRKICSQATLRLAGRGRPSGK